jgi:hypothetical protein
MTNRTREHDGRQSRLDAHRSQETRRLVSVVGAITAVEVALCMVVVMCFVFCDKSDLLYDPPFFFRPLLLVTILGVPITGLAWIVGLALLIGSSFEDGNQQSELNAK